MIKAVSFAVMSLMAWSLYPVLTAFGILQIDPILFVLIVQISAAIGSLCFALPFISDFKVITKSVTHYARHMPFESWVFYGLVGLCSALFNVFIVLAMTLIEPAAVAIIVQTSPIFTMIFSYYLIRKNWNALGVNDFAVAAMSLCGAAIVIVGNPYSFGDSSSRTAQSFIDHGYASFLAIIGGAIAILAAIMVAFSNAMRAEISNIIKKLIPKSAVKGDPTISGAFIGETVCRLSSIVPAAIIWLIWGDFKPVTMESFAAAVFTGFFVFNIASAALTLALLYAKNSSITLISFLGPIVSVFWLSLFDLSEITPLIIVGMVIIISGNALLYSFHSRNK